jgi:hypothetical protein
MLPAVLPRLHGVGLGLFRLAFALVFALAVFSAAGATWFEARETEMTTAEVWSGSVYGLGMRIFPPVAAKGWRVMRPYSAEAVASGMRSGDDIVGLNGRPITRATGVGRFPQLIDAREGRRAVFTLRGANGAVRDRVVTWHAANVETWYRGSGLDPWRQTMARRFAYDLMALLLLLPASVLFLRRPREIVAAAFSLSLALLSLGPTNEYWGALGLLGAYNIFSTIPYILVLMIGCAFPDGRFWPRWTRFSLVVVPLAYLPLAPFGVDYSNVALYTAPAYVALIAILALRYGRLPAGAERQQFRWVAFGLAAGVFTLLLRFSLIWAQARLSPAPLSPWVDFSASFLHALGYAIIGGGFGIALLRFRLYDAESLVSRSAALASTTLLLGGVWGASERAIEIAFSGLLGQGAEGAATVIGAGIAVMLITPLHGRMHKWIEKRFSSEVWDLKERLPEKVTALSQRVGTQALCEAVIDHIARAVRVTPAALVLRRDERLIVAAHRGILTDQVCAGISTESLPQSGEMLDETAIFPFRLALGEEDGACAWLLLGPRPDGTACNRDERGALAELAASLGRAIETTEARDEHDGRIAELLRALEARLGAIEADITRGRVKRAPASPR